MTTRNATTQPPPVVPRIGDVAKHLCSATDMARVTRVRDLQELLGFSIAEVGVVVDTENVDVLDRVRSEYRSGDVPPDRRHGLLDEANEATDRLLTTFDTTLARISPFREERAAKSFGLRAARDELGDVDDQFRPTQGANRP
jgi:hypothetical protein